MARLAVLVSFNPRNSEEVEAVLQKYLSDAERKQLEDDGYLKVPSPNFNGRIYRVYPQRGGMASVYEAGQEVLMLFLLPKDWVHSSLIPLIHKLMIEGDEKQYLRTANQFEPPCFFSRRNSFQTSEQTSAGD